MIIICYTKTLYFVITMSDCSITITNESVWNGYGWGFDELMSVLDKKIGVKNEI